MLFNLTNSQIRWMMILSLAFGIFVGIPVNLVISKFFGLWYFWLTNVVSMPFIVLNTYWTIFPQSYNKFVNEWIGWWMKKSEKILELE